jgi:hypothetical protein
MVKCNKKIKDDNNKKIKYTYHFICLVLQLDFFSERKGAHLHRHCFEVCICRLLVQTQRAPLAETLL